MRIQDICGKYGEPTDRNYLRVSEVSNSLHMFGMIRSHVSSFGASLPASLISL